MYKLFKNIVLSIVFICIVFRICYGTMLDKVYPSNGMTNKETLVNLLNQTAQNDSNFFDDCFNGLVDPETIIDTKKYNDQLFNLKKRKWAMCRIMDSENKVKAVKALKIMESNPKVFYDNKKMYEKADDDLNKIILSILRRFNSSAADTMKEEIKVGKKLKIFFKSTEFPSLIEVIELLESVKNFKNLHETFLKELGN